LTGEEGVCTVQEVKTEIPDKDPVSVLNEFHQVSGRPLAFCPVANTGPPYSSV